MKKIFKLPLLLFALVLIFCTCAVIVLADTQTTAENVTLTITPEGGTPTVEENLTYQAAMNEIKNLKPETPTEYKIDCFTDVTATANTAMYGNSDKTVVVNLNGHDLTVVKNGMIPFQICDNVSIVVNGRTNENRSEIVSKNPSGHFVYMKKQTGNTDPQFTMNNVDVIYTNQSTFYCGDNGIYPNPAIFHVQIGDVNLTNCDILFTGEDAKGGVATVMSLKNMYVKIMQFSNDSTLTATNCVFDGTNSKGIKTYAVGAGGTVKATLNGCYLDGVIGVETGANGNVDLTDCTVKASNTVLLGAGNVNVKNTALIAGDATVISGSDASLKFFEGTSFDKKPEGTYTLDNGYGIYNAGDCYKVVSNGGIYFSSLFSNGMVFQRNEPIHVFGYCDTNGKSVTATLGSQSKTTTVANGKWEVVFDALPATKGLSLSILAGGSQYLIVFEDIDIGEVWLLAGQSNMRNQVRYIEDAAEYYANADNFDNIRFYTQDKAWSFEEQKNTQNGYWSKATKDAIKNLSGIGYVMATNLASEMEDVTIAVVDTSYEGSAIQSWLPVNTVRSISESDYQTYLTNKAQYESDGTTAKTAYHLAETCHNRMIAPLAGYVVKGVIWYQGESNAGSPDLYKTYYSALTSFWRDLFNNETLPFVVMQLAPNGAKNYATFRLAQYDIVQADPYSYIVSTAMDGPIFNELDNQRSGGSQVHPSRKAEIGLRTGELILGKIYGIEFNRPYTAPEIVSVEFKSNSVVITFDTDLKILWGDTVMGFELGKGGSYVSATGTISGNVLTLTADGSDFDSVRYSYATLIVERKDGTLMEVNTGIPQLYDSNNKLDIHHVTVTEHGLVGTLAIIAKNVIGIDDTLTANAAEWQRLVNTGLFDVANHTQTHTWYGFTDKVESGTYTKKNGSTVKYSYPAGHMTNEIVGAAERLRVVFPGQRVLTYVIPGFTNESKWNGRDELPCEIIRNNFISQRSTSGTGNFDGVLVPRLNKIGDINFESLNCLMVLSTDTVDGWLEYVDNMLKYNGWGIYCFHNILPKVGSGHYVLQSDAAILFDYIAEKVKNEGLWCATLTDASLYTKEYQYSTAKANATSTSIEVSITDGLDDEIFNMALTVKIDIPDDWATFTLNGKTVTASDILTDESGNRYIMTDLVPDVETAVLEKVN